MEIKVPSLVRIKPKALFKLGKYIRDLKHKNIVILWGEGVKEIFNSTVEVSLLSADVNILLDSVIKSNDIEELFKFSIEDIPKRADLIVSIGGGKIIDIGKYVSFLRNIPLYSVPTVVSNDGFCSPMASLLVKNNRTTLKTQLPEAVIVDTEIIQNAPVSFLYSGMGDLFCKITSVYDWKLAFKKTGEPVNDFAANIARNAADTFIYYDDKSPDNRDFIRVIATSLMISGISMEIARSSRPASGSEHLISHAYDLLNKRKPSLHGLQVGVASYAVSLIQEETHQIIEKVIKESGFFSFMRENPLHFDTFVEAIKIAPYMKENFYTILSEKENVERLIQLVEKDPLLNEMLSLSNQ